jgi:hypothetical protein
VEEQPVGLRLVDNQGLLLETPEERAEARAVLEATARQTAEARAALEAAARQTAEARVLELEAELRRRPSGSK